MSEIEIEIDGKKLQAKPNATIIQVADEAGIYIPRFCYHKHLSVAANCRMCLVEVEKSPKALPACATPVMPGMKVMTRSSKALAAQKAVMEFLLINHPLDCPICDQGGECELQDLSMGFGSDESFYCEGKRSVKDQNIGPLVATEMTRCIQCTRCVRFGTEVAGLRELGVVSRGEASEITTYVQHALESEISGNIIDLCPVGALTSKPFRFKARAWELDQFPSVAPHDCVGSNVYVHTRRGTVMRVVPRENKTINQTWLSDRDRFSYEGLYHEDRLEKPLIRRDGKWEETDWQTALNAAVEGLQKVLNAQTGEQVAALASPNSTTEEFYLLQKLMRSLGSNHIDHRLRQVDFSDQDAMGVFPGITFPLEELNNFDTIFLIGTNVQRDQPLLSARIRQASLKGAKIIVLNMMDYAFHFSVAHKSIVAPHEFTAALNRITNEETIQTLFQNNRKACVLLGAQAFQHPEAAKIRQLASSFATQSNAQLGFLTEGANAAGAWLSGAIPNRDAAGKTTSGLNAQTMFDRPRQAYLLLNVEPDLDTANPMLSINALSDAEFVLACSSFKNPILEQFAHVILPITPYTETSGTFINAEGHWQGFQGVAPPLGDARPGWKVLRVLANFLGCEGFEYKTSEEVLKEMETACLSRGISRNTGLNNLYTKTDSNSNVEQVSASGERLSRVGEIPIYAGDSLVRRAPSLQATQLIMDEHLLTARIHPETAQRLSLREKEMITVTQTTGGRLKLPVVFDARTPRDAVYLVGGIALTSNLSQLFGPVEIQKA